MYKTILFCLLSCFVIPSAAQTGQVKGTVKMDNKAGAFVNVYLSEISKGSQTDENGNFTFSQLPYGDYTLEVSYVGFKDQKVAIHLNQAVLEVDIKLEEANLLLDEVVVTGTKTFKRKTDSPVIVNVLSQKNLEDVQACNLSEGLRFQPGLRVETDCQTCNYTQLRMNGLGGGYSQILINGRPIFSPLTGLYGLEQLPTNMIERIEVVRGGGSSLYGSSAIGGTVNVITRLPEKNSYSLDYSYQNINEAASDHQLNGNASLVNNNKSAGISFFINKRERDFYDHNDDNFSELPKLSNTSLGINLFVLPSENQKIDFSLSNLNEYRFGGEMELEKPAYLTQQSEERTHKVWMTSLDYQINFNNELSSLIVYAAGQYTDRKHYTGILPDKEEEEAYQTHIENPPYGISDVKTLNTGLQLNHRLNDFLKGSNMLTLGAEYIYDAAYDEIAAYQYLVDQKTKNIGVFVQSDWQIIPSLSLLMGVRMDEHNLLDKVAFNPRMSLLYKLKSQTQFRLNYGTGFRAPQSFDTDLHIAFAGGGVSRVVLADDLQSEQSESWSASVNYDKPSERSIFGFTLEGFYTQLDRAFILQPIGEDAYGEVFEKQNGQGSSVKGMTIELRGNYDRKYQLETGITLQSSQYKEAVSYIDSVEPIKDFIRTPNEYAFATFSWMPSQRFNINVNYIYTGTMKVPHFAGAPNQEVDEIIDTPSFSELSFKASYKMELKRIKANLSFYGGVKNIFNDYQSSFDIGKNRDSNFVYGPGQARTFFVGVKYSSGL